MPAQNSITLRYRPLLTALLEAQVVTPTPQPLPWVMRPQYLPDFPWGQTPHVAKDINS